MAPENRFVPAAVLVAVSLLAGACAGSTLDARPATDELRHLVAERGGVLGAPASVDEILAADPALSADRAAAIALLNNGPLLADLEDLGVAHAALAQATLWPNSTVHGGLQRRSPGGGSKIEIGISFRLLDILLVPARRRMAAAEYEAARLRIGHRMLDVLTEAKAAVHRQEAAEQMFGRLDLLRQLDEAAAELAVRQGEAGNLSQLDIALHRARLHQTEVELTQAGLEVARAREGVRRALGWNGAEGDWSVSPRLPEPATHDTSLSGLEDRAIENRLDLAAARFAVGAVEQATRLRRRTRWFPVGIEIGVDRERDPDGSRLVGPSLTLQLPIFDTGRAGLAALEAEERRARRQLEAAEGHARSRVREAHAGMSVARDLVDFHRRTVLPERVGILDETVRRYNMMIAGVYDVLEARRLELEAEKALIRVWLDYWLARVDLERELGFRLEPEPRPGADPAPASGGAA